MCVSLYKFSELKSRDYLDKCLSSALNVPLKNGRISAIDERKYVLTLDYTLKVSGHGNKNN